MVGHRRTHLVPLHHCYCQWGLQVRSHFNATITIKRLSSDDVDADDIDVESLEGIGHHLLPSPARCSHLPLCQVGSSSNIYFEKTQYVRSVALVIIRFIQR